MTPAGLDLAYSEYRETQKIAEDALWSAVLRYVRTIVYSSPDPDALTAEVTAQIWAAFPSFRGRSQFSTWVHRIAKNRLRNAWRDRDRSKRHIGREDLSERATSPDHNALPPDMTDLPEDIRQIAAMLSQGHTVREIAAARKCSERTIKRTVKIFSESVSKIGRVR